MARSEARLQFGLWRAGLDGLSPNAKLMYCVLLTEPTLNHCGVGAVRISRWARDASLSIEDTEKALAELTDSAHVVIDDDTEEVFVRTLIRRDGVADQPYVLKGALREAVLTSSPQIRKALAAELRKLPPRQPDGVSKAGKKVTYPDPHATADELDPPGSPKPTRKGSENLFDENPSERVSKGSSSKGSESLHGGGGGGGGISPSSGGSVSRPAQKRGTRIPDDFAVTPEMVAWAQDNTPDVDGRIATEKFIDYWRAKAGKDGVKLDWIGTWRNWMRGEQERAPQRNGRLRVVNGRALSGDGVMRDPRTGVAVER